jgi:hypothetical protein
MVSKAPSGDIKAAFETLSKDAHLDLLLPRSNEFNVSKLLQDGSPEELARIPSRRNLFFGSTLALPIFDLISTNMKLGQTRTRLSS